MSAMEYRDGITSEAVSQLGKTGRLDGDEAGIAASNAPLKNLAHADYTVGWICAIRTELVAAQAFLDEKHPRPEYVPHNDNNDYTLGRVGKHNVVIAVLPDGEYGISSATAVARDMLRSFPNVRIGLMVGIGGGAPSQKHDIRLGDIVVSAPRRGNSGVFQYDFGKTIQGGRFHVTGFLDQPPVVLRTAVSGLMTDYESEGNQLDEAIHRILEKKPRMRKKYSRPDPSSDRLYKTEVTHPPNNEESCITSCDNDPSKLISRHERSEDEDNPAVHYGLIASANQVMKDAQARDKLAAEKDVLCFEMEAAGLMNQFPCLVIRGICDYSDTHKNKEWQGYAAMAAAAYARDLLYRILPNRVEAEKRISDILSGVQEGVSEILHVQRDQVHENILKWLTPIDYTPQQKLYIGMHQPGTDQWFLDSEEYRAWLKSDKQTLFCPGVPGAGKTIITAIVVDDLHTRYKSSSNVGIVYLYCDFQRQYEQKTEDLLANLLRQLSQKQTPIPESVQALYDKYKDQPKRPSLEEISAVIHSVSTSYSRLFIIIDALDECQVTDGCRKRLLSEIFKLHEECRANVFATSRFIPDIVQTFEKSTQLTINAREEDIQKYLAGKMSLLPSFVLRSPDLQNEIKALISKAADGMFLLARLHIDSLAREPTVGHIELALRNLPRELGKTYNQAMLRIERQGGGSRELGKRVLSWLIYAKRVLSTAEIRHAVAVEPGKPQLNGKLIPDIEIIGSICAGLVTIDTQSDVVRLAHYTVQEYFQGEGKDYFRNAETDITVICITYISFDVFQKGPCETDNGFEERLQSNELYHYASHNWGHHAHSAPEEQLEEQLILDFLESKAKVSASSQAVMMAVRDNYSVDEVPDGMTGVHLAAYFGLGCAIYKLLKNEHDADTRDSYGRTPLSYAAENGHEAIVLLLLERGANVDSESISDQTPLLAAVWSGHEATVQLLLENGADIEARDERGRTPLSLAIGLRYGDMIKILVENGADIEARDERGRTPFFLAIGLRYGDMIKILVENGADIEARDEDGQTPLFLAIGLRYGDIIKILVENGADIEARGQRGRTPLFLAVILGYEDVVQLLLERGADVDSKDNSGWTPLSWAVENGHGAIVELLQSTLKKVR